MTSKVIRLLFVDLNLESLERKVKNYKKLEYLENENNFLDEIKNVFHNV